MPKGGRKHRKELIILSKDAAQAYAKNVFVGADGFLK
jgi:hypothetical protein